jgi:hypothetical protein
VIRWVHCRFSRPALKPPRQHAAYRPAAAAIEPNGNHAQSDGERRRHRRQRVVKKAAIVFRGGLCSIGCYLLDLSEAGAQVMPVDMMSCPGEFLLKPSFGAERNCKVVWRTDGKMGLRYL